MMRQQQHFRTVNKKFELSYGEESVNNSVNRPVAKFPACARLSYRAKNVAETTLLIGHFFLGLDRYSMFSGASVA